MANNATKTLTTDLNVSPYYDDYNQDKNFYKILFKPGFAIQARELTQIQSMLQDQISKLGQHIFQEGSKVLDGEFLIDKKTPYVRVKDIDSTGNNINIIDYAGKILVGQTTNVSAFVETVLDGTENSSNNKTLYVRYLSGSADANVSLFSNNETLVSNTGNTLVVTSASSTGINPTGFGSIFKIDTGVRFSKGYFVYHPKQTIVIDRYGTLPNCKVGFKISESIVTSDIDGTLLDPAKESSNFSAPGADRFRLVPELIRIDQNDILTANSIDYVELFDIKDGILQSRNDRPTYNIIQDEIAKRTYDESGDYYVNGLDITIRENLNIDNNNGLYSDGDANLLSIGVNAGTAYIKGYEFNNLVTRYVNINKSNTTIEVNNEITSAQLGVYAIVDECVGNWIQDKSLPVELYDVPMGRISDKIFSAGAQGGTKIGTAKLKSFEYLNGSSGSARAQFKAYLFDIQMNSGKSFSKVKSIYRDGTTDGTASIGADIVLELGNDTTTEFLTNLYDVALNRAPDAPGLSYYQSRINNNLMTRRDVVIDFFNSYEYEVANYTGANDDAKRENFVKSLFLKLLNRQVDTAGLAFYKNVYATSGKYPVIIDILGSAEFNTKKNLNILFGGKAKLYDMTTAPVMIYKMGSNSVQTLRTSGVSDTSFTFKRTTTKGSVSSSGSFTIGLGTNSPIEKFTYGSTTSLSEEQKKEIIVTCEQALSIAIPTYTVSTNSGSTTVTATGGLTNFNVGDKITITDVSGLYTISSIESSTQLTLTTAVSSTVSNKVFYKRFEVGDIIDLNGKGTTGNTAGAIRTVTSVTPTSMTVNLNENFGTSVSMSFSYRINRSSAEEVKKILRANAYVKISCSSDQRGPYVLGFSDVYKIKSVIKKSGTYPDSETDGTDVTSYFTLDNGQKDDFYDHSKLVLKSGYTLLSTDRLLVKFDYFEPNYSTGFGFFSIDSYPVNDSIVSLTTIKTQQIPSYKSINTGKLFDLRNCLDFRPVKKPIVSYTTTVSSAPVVTAPNSPVDFYVDANGVRLPATGSQISYDYSFYVGRIDQIALDKDGNIIQIPGIPNIVPIAPVVPDNYMGIGTIYITPYPSLSPAYAISSNRTDLACRSKKTGHVRYTMRDIGVIDNRLKSVEYYTTLSLLEKSTLDLKILDSSTPPLDRFKNGIFVDPFNDENLSAKNVNPDHYICVDSKEKSIRPVYETETINYGYVTESFHPQTGKSGLKRNGNIITLDYDEVTLLEQQNATTYRNVETSIYRFIGSVYLFPDHDNWVDTKWSDALRLFQDLSVGQENNVGRILSTVWNAWETNWSGFHSWNNQAEFDSPTSFTLDANPTAAAVDSVTNFRRTGTQIVTAIGEVVESYGNRVIDVNLNLYVRPQQIVVASSGLKPHTEYYVFFDGENMSDYVTPIDVASIDVYANTSYPDLVTANTLTPVVSAIYLPGKVEGDPLVTDANGELCGILRLPSEKHFKVGTKQVVVTDSPTNEDDATSAGHANFVAQGLTQTKQETIMTTKKVIAQSNAIEETRTERTVVRRPPPPPPVFWWWGSCMAYTFIARAPQNEEGFFLTSVDLYCARKDATKGIWVEIRAMDNAGNITRTQVPGTEVHLRPSQLNTSDDGSVATRITFPAPVFFYNNIEYALVIHTEAANPNTYFFVSVLGQNDLLTGQPVTSRAYTGNLYTTNNNLDWNKVDRTDLKVKFNRAKFQTDFLGTVTIGNLPVEITTDITSISTPFGPKKGEMFSTNDKLTLSGVSGSALSVGDIIVQSVDALPTYDAWVYSWGTLKGKSYIESQISSINGSTYTMGNQGFVAGYPFTAKNSDGSAKNTTGTIADVTRGNMILRDFNETSLGTDLIMIDTNGQISSGDILRGSSSNVYAVINTFGKLKYSVIDFEPSYLNFSSTSLNFNMKDYSVALSDYGTETIVTPNENHDLLDEKCILSRRDEIASKAGANSHIVTAALGSSSEYLSPLIDIDRSYSILVHNLINSNTYNEYVSAGGNLTNKYVSKIVTLAERQDAEDLQTIITAFKPSGSDVKIWAKVCNGDDLEAFDDKMWFELLVDNIDLRSSLSGLNDFREFTYNIPETPCDIIIFDTADTPPLMSAGFTFTGQTSGITATVTGVKNEIKVVDKTGFTDGEDVLVKNQSGTTIGTYTIESIGHTPSTSGPNGEVTYTNNDGRQFFGFKQFQIKIGLLSDNSAIVPRVADLRCIALQM